MENNTRIAVKAFIINNGKLLILKRADNDVHKPGIWEIPGGRIENNEDLITALKREVKEETGLDIIVSRRLSIRHFTRDDKEEIEMHIFLSNSVNEEVKLSDEHILFEWIEIEKCKEKLTSFFHSEVDLLFKIEDEKWP